MSEGGIPGNLRSLSSSDSQQRIPSMRRLLSLDVACRRLQLLPGRLLRIQSLPSPRSSVQSSPEFVSVAQSLLDLPLNTKSSSPMPPLSNTPSIRIDGGTTEENWNEAQSNTASHNRNSPQTTVFYSCDDGEGNREAFRRGSSNHKVLEWIFAIANFIIELASIVFDQLSSQHNSLFLPICMGMSFLALIICLFELVYKVRKERTAWKWKDTMPCFYHPSEPGLPSGPYIEILGLVCAFGQCVVVTTNYCLYLRTGKSPIKISIWAAIFAFCQLCSKLFKEFRQDVSSVELTSSAW